ncbi:hypothetical protein Cgig2_021055 [Carnegiea gigantea]|uniref:Kinesin light chain n=1 Tax=Carnegiea gigantea TaxID=171969 RepID=A0A9Q1JPZ0_9CARY|nr:hypothetical protein Cgig2_021055 [Carnegiea gigantea]
MHDWQGLKHKLGILYYMLGHYVDSYNALKSSILRFRSFRKDKSSLYGITLNQLGRTCVQLCAISEASQLFNEAKNILENEYGLHHPDTLNIYSNLAGTYDALGRWDDAIELLEFVIEMREAKLGTADPIVDNEKQRLSELLKVAGRTRRRKSKTLRTLLDEEDRFLTRIMYSSHNIPKKCN